MAVIDIDYDMEAAQNAASGAHIPLPNGWYVWQVVGLEYVAAKEQGKYPQHKLQIEIRDSFNKANLGRKRVLFLSHSPKAAPYRLTPFLRAAGIPFQDNGAGKLRFDDAPVLGATVKAVSTLRSNDRGEYEEWDKFEPVGHAGPSALTNPTGVPTGFPVQQPPAGGFQPPIQPPMQQQPPPGWGAPTASPPAQGAPQWGPPPGAPPQQPQQPPWQQPAAFPQPNAAPPAAYPQAQQPQFPQQPPATTGQPWQTTWPNTTQGS